MTKHEDGGPAFPIETTATPYAPGMSLRDAAALAAFQAILTSDELCSATIQLAALQETELCTAFAASAFDFADAFIKVRESRNTPNE